MPAHRQSALLLHGLGKLDQRWVLSQLPEADRRVLDEHLAELKALGIPAEPALGEQAGQARTRAAASPLHAVSVEAITKALAGEPVWMLRQVLALADWPWRDAWLATFSDAQRERLVQGPAAVLPAHAAERLQAQLTERLALVAGLGAHPARSAAHGPLDLLRQTLRRWL